MSDTSAPLTSESAAPMSSTDIAAHVVESAETGHTTGAEHSDDTGETTEAAGETSVTDSATETATKAELSAARKFLQKLGHAETNKRGGNTYLPYLTVEKMLDKYAEEHGQSWTTEKTTLESKAKELQSHIDSLRAGVAGDPKAFLAELASIDPRYQSFLTPQQQERREAVADAANDPMPQPDFDLGNGTQTYSVEGMEKRMAWERRQALRELEGKLDERFKPIAEREKAEQARAAQEASEREFKTRFETQMAEAQTWPLFGPLAKDGSLTDFQKLVLDELKADSAKKLTLEGAYIRVASKRMTEDDTAKRARLMEEINKAPRSTATGRTTTDTTAHAGPRSSADVAREVVARLEKGA